MSAYRIVDLENGIVPIIFNMLDLGYKVSEKGICLGLSAMAMQAMLLGKKELEKFDRRLYAISILSLSDLEYFQNPKRKKLTNKEQVRLNQILAIFDGKVEDIFAFFDGVALYQSPISYTELFPNEIAPLIADQNKLLLTSTLTASQKIEKHGGIIEANHFLGAYNLENLKDFFSSLRLAVEKTNSKKPISLILHGNSYTGMGNKHTICVSYDPATEQWQLVDNNSTIYINGEDKDSEIARRVNAVFSNNNITIFSYHLYGLKDDETQLKQIVKSWEKSDKWKEIHAINEERLKFTDSNNINLSKWAAAKTLPSTISANNFELLDYILTNIPGIDVNADIGEKKNSLLFLAAHSGNLEIVKRLCQQPGINIDKICNSNSTALYIAAQQGHTKIVAYLLSRSLNSLKNGVEASVSVLQAGAAQFNKQQELNLLLANSGKAFTNFTPLHAAAFFGHVDVVKALIAAGADINAKTSNGISAYQFAEALGHTKIVNIFKENFDPKSTQIYKGLKDYLTAIDLGSEELDKRHSGLKEIKKITDNNPEFYPHHWDAIVEISKDHTTGFKNDWAKSNIIKKGRESHVDLIYRTIAKFASTPKILEQIKQYLSDNGKAENKTLAQELELSRVQKKYNETEIIYNNIHSFQDALRVQEKSDAIDVLRAEIHRLENEGSSLGYSPRSKIVAYKELINYLREHINSPTSLFEILQKAQDLEVNAENPVTLKEVLTWNRGFGKLFKAKPTSEVVFSRLLEQSKNNADALNLNEAKGILELSSVLKLNK